MKEISNNPQQIAACGLYCGACKKFLDGKGKTDDDEKEMRHLYAENTGWTDFFFFELE